MSVPVFQSDGALKGAPATGLAAGGCALWRMRSNVECLAALDAVTGIVRPPAGAVRWFGRDISALEPREVMATLQCLAPLTAAGGLLGNIRMADNILLPCEARGRGAAGESELRDLLSKAPWSGWFPESELRVLPYQTGDLARALAGVLRAWLVHPEAIVACNVWHLLEHGERATLSSALSWVRAGQPGCAWLFIQTESDLPPGFTANNLAQQP